ncbi:MAG: two-component regulator propeller domain-containing protein [Syntrophomonadaceae bacterium]
MKRYFTLIIYACLFAVIQPGFSPAQSSGGWRHYFGHNYVRAMAAQKDTLWIGYDYGIEERIISTGEYRVFFTSRSGLNSNYVNSLQIDPSGNKWIAVGKRYDYLDQYGLIKFNGTDWTYYTQTDSGYPVYPLYFAIDSSGSIWITGYNSLIRFDGKNWTVIEAKEQDVKWETTYSFAIDNAGNKWIGADKKLVKFYGTKWENIMLPGSLSSPVDAITFDSKNNLWAVTQSARLMKYDGYAWAVYNKPPLSGNSITAIYIDKKDNIWIGLGKSYSESNDSSYGLAMFDGINWTIYNKNNSGLPSNYVTAITGDTYGNIWIGTYDKSYVKFDGTKWQSYNSSNSSLTAANINSVAIDTKGNKWFTTKGGLSEFDGNLWELYDQFNSGLPANAVYSVAFDSAGNKWIATDSGLAKYDDKNWTVYNTHNSGLPENSISIVAVDKKNVKWIGSSLDNADPHKGLVSFDGTDWNIYNMDNSPLPTNSIGTITIDSAGNKWIVYKDYEWTAPSFPLWLSGLFKFNDTSWVNYLDYAGLPIYAAEFDRQGKLWIGGRGFGLTVFDGKEWKDYYRKNSDLPCDTVTAIAADSNGYIWIGTMRGLAVTNGTEWKIYNTLNSELRSDYINSLAVDDSNYLWIAAKNNFVSTLKLWKDIFTGSETAEISAIKDYSLSQNYPNPFNPATTISYYLPHATEISLKLFDILGREAAILEEGFRQAGNHKVRFNASSLPSGVYIYRLKAGDFIASKKLLLIK